MREVNGKIYDIDKAIAAQWEYCDKHALPHFAPVGGRCSRCGWNVFEPREYSNGVTGVDVETAGRKHITGCPHCNNTFCD